MVQICSEEAVFKIWLKSVEFEGMKNTPNMSDIAGGLEDAGGS